MAQRREDGLCYNCDDFYTPDHICQPVLFYIKCVVDGEDQEDELIEEDFKISLNAINREQTETTFQVQVDIETGKGWVLLDTRSTHNFIKSSMVETLGISMKHRA